MRPDPWIYNFRFRAAVLWVIKTDSFGILVLHSFLILIFNTKTRGGSEPKNKKYKFSLQILK